MRIRLFDHPGVWAEERRVLRPGKPFAMLALLTVESAPISRGEVCALLWPDAVTSRGRASLRQALVTLGQAVGRDFLRIDGEWISVGAEVDSDFAQLRRRIREARVEDAVTLWGGGFLDGVRIDYGRGWSRWVEEQRTSLTRQLLRAASTKVRALAAQPDPREIVSLIDLVGATLTLPIDLELEKVEALVAMGELAAAHRAIEDLCLRGADELSLEQRTRVESLTRAAAHPPRPFEMEAGPRSLPLAGRDEELQLARTRVRSETGAGVLVSGPAGIGKTRFVEELSASLSEYRVAVVACDIPDRDVPWAVLSKLIRAVAPLPGSAGISSLAAAALCQLAPSVAPQLGVAPSGDGTRFGPSSLADALLDLIDAVAHEEPLLVVVDDVQWADPDSFRVLRVVCTTARAASAFALACRSGEAETRHLMLLRRNGTDPDLLEFALEPLGAEEVDWMLAPRLPDLEGSERRRFAERLALSSGGNPLALSTTLDDLEADGYLVRSSHDDWALLAPADELPLPDSFLHLVRARVETLSGPARRLLRRVAEQGRPLPIGRGEENVAAGRELVEREFVIEQVPGELVLRHDALRPGLLEVIERPSWASARSGLAVAAILVLLAIIPFAVRAAGGGSTVVPDFQVVAASKDSVYLLRFDEATHRWVRSRAESTRGLSAYRATLDPDGRIVLAGAYKRSESVPPDAAFAEIGADPRIVLAESGDDNGVGVAADGSLVVTSSVPEADRYQTPFYRIQDSTTVPLYPSRTLASVSSLSPDGRLVLTMFRGRRDTVVVFDLEGQARHRFTPDGTVADAVWCDRSSLAVQVASPGELPELVRYSLESGAESDWQMEGMSSLSTVGCYGDWVLASGVVRGEEGVFIAHVPTFSLFPLGLLLPPTVQFFTLLPRVQAPRPVSLEERPDSLSVLWGGAAPLPSRVRCSDGRVEVGVAEWRSSNPGVASASGHTLVANRPGVAHLTPWVDDLPLVPITVSVLAGDGPPPGSVFASPMGAGALGAWHRIGRPTARVTEFAGEEVTELLGDGSYPDGLITREEFTLERGGSLELEFRIEFTQDDYQSFRACLSQGVFTALEPSSHLDWNETGGVCFMLPASLGPSFHPRRASFGGHAERRGPILLPVEYGTGEWTRLRIDILPDGASRLHLNGELIHEIDTRRPTGAGAYRISLWGKAVDTRVMVRNVILREGSGPAEPPGPV